LALRNCGIFRIKPAVFCKEEFTMPGSRGPVAAAISVLSSAQSTEIAMSQLRKPLYQRSEGADEDRWCLVFDTDANSLFVEHEIQRGDMRGAGYSIHTEAIEVADFLNQRGQDHVHQDHLHGEHAQGQHELLRLLGALFEDRKEAAMA
jgi:hypothetical protein